MTTLYSPWTDKSRQSLKLEIGRHELFLELIDLIHASKRTYADIAKEAKVSVSTVYHWASDNGTTKSPRLDTMVKVLGALGYRLAILLSRRQENWNA